MSRAYVVVVCLALGACASDPQSLSQAGPAKVPDKLILGVETDAAQIELADGSPAWAVTAKSKSASHYRAKALCPGGYNVLSEDAASSSRLIGLVDKGTPSFASERNYKLFVSCVPAHQDEEQPSP